MSADSNTASPQVEVELIGIPVDCAKQRTRVVSRNSLNPLFQDSFRFRIAFADLAFVRFAVLDASANGHVVTQRVIPLTCLQPGYRHVRLRSPSNARLPVSSLTLSPPFPLCLSSDLPANKSLSCLRADLTSVPDAAADGDSCSLLQVRAHARLQACSLMYTVRSL